LFQTGRSNTAWLKRKATPTENPVALHQLRRAQLFGNKSDKMEAGNPRTFQMKVVGRSRKGRPHESGIPRSGATRLAQLKSTMESSHHRATALKKAANRLGPCDGSARGFHCQRRRRQRRYAINQLVRIVDGPFVSPRGKRLSASTQTAQAVH
jgi:hypothetical protein